MYERISSSFISPVALSTQLLHPPLSNLRSVFVLGNLLNSLPITNAGDFFIKCEIYDEESYGALGKIELKDLGTY